jgi:simple sugar transport system ATP-binding protein
MTLAPDVLLVSEPTRGIDIQAKSRVLGILAELNAAGTSLLVTSSELAELRALCHRILVVHAGRVDAELSPEDSDRAFGLAMAGEAGARA